jgi:hypothetical protein
MKNNEIRVGSPINGFEEIIDNYQDIGKLHWTAFKKHKIINILIIILIFILIFILFKSPWPKLPKWLDFISYVFLLLFLAYFQLKNMAICLREIGFDCKNWWVAWSKIEYFRDKIFYKKVNSKGYDVIKLKNLKKYIHLKIKEEEREWSVPRFVTLGIIGAIGYSFLNTYLTKLSAGILINAFVAFIIFSIFIVIFELIVRSVILIFRKQDKYSQLLSSINTAIIRLQNEKNINNE